MTQRLVKFCKPFENHFQEKDLFIYIAELCKIPVEMCTDWVIYDTIMHHLIMNAIKFNKFKGGIIIDLSYQELYVSGRCNLGLLPQLPHAIDDSNRNLI